MKTLRLFISSPGDVAEERDRARQVIEGLRRRYAGVFHLKPVLWEDLPLQANSSFQEGIDRMLSEEGGIAVAVFILWSRMGQLQEGGRHRSGTEREFELMLAARERSGGVGPALLVYCREDDTSFEERLRGRPTGEQRDLIEQKVQVEQFIAERFQDAETGRNLRAFHRFDRPQSFSQRLRVHLTELLDDLAGGESAAAVWDLKQDGPPFLGLEAFQARHAAVFFGREDEVLEARHALANHAREGCAFLLITGASGSGKSSLARAGLLPAIAEQELDESVVEWRPLIITPSELGADPAGALVERLAVPALLPGLRAEGVAFDEVVGAFRQANAGGEILLKQAVAAAGRVRGGGVRVLLLIDQLEEIFALARRAEFTGLIEWLARSGAIWVVATVRSDFLGDVYGESVLARLLEGRSVLTVLPPETDALRRMIEEPARLAGLHFEPRGERRLSDQILADAARHADLLPLVEFVLWRLAERRSAEGRLSWKVYEDELQGVGGALRLQAEGVFDALADDLEAQTALPAVLKRLVTVGETVGGPQDGAERYLRQRVELAAFPKGSAARRLVEALVRARLLTADGGESPGSGTVSVAHEALLRVWPRAAAWAEGNRDLLRTRARVESRMREEKAQTIAEGDPLLEAAKVHLEADPEAFTEAQRAFIEKSVATVESNRLRRERLRRRVVVGLSVLTLMALGAALWALAERDSAQIQLERSLLNEGRIWYQMARRAWESEKDPYEALMLAGRAVGFHGLGRSEGSNRLTSDQPFPSLLGETFSHPENETERAIEEGEVRALIQSIVPTGLPLWSSPVQAHHEGTVETVAFSRDGTRLASGSEDSSVKVWDFASGELLASLEGHSARVFCVAFSPDGKQVISGSADNTVKLWDMDTGRELATLNSPSGPFASVAVSPDRKRIACGLQNGTVVVWEIDRGEVVYHLPGHGHVVESVVFSPDGSQLVCGSSWGKKLKLWDMAKGEELRSFEWRPESVAFSPDGRRVASGDIDGKVRLWDAMTGEELGMFQAAPISAEDITSLLTIIAFSPDGRILATWARNGGIRLWDATSLEELGHLEGSEQFVVSLCFSPDGVHLASGGNRMIKLWDIAREKELSMGAGHQDEVTSVAYSPDGMRLASGSDDHTVKLWDVITGKELATLKGHEENVTSVAFSPDGMQLASGSEDKTVKLWDVVTGKELATLGRHEKWVTSVSFSPEGQILASASYDGTVKIWDLVDMMPAKLLAEQSDGFTSVAFSRDGKRLAAGDSEGRVTLWDPLTGEELANAPGHSRWVTSLAFRPDGILASGAADNEILLRDLETGSLLETLRVPTGVNSLVGVNSIAFNRDGSRLASTAGDKTVRLWISDGGKDANLGQQVAALPGRNHQIRSVSFSPDGKRLAGGLSDGTVRVWDVAEDSNVASLDGYSLTGFSAVHTPTAAFTPDGKRVISGSMDRKIRIWDAATGKLNGILSGHSSTVNEVQVSPDGTRLASRSEDNAVILWDSHTGKNLATLCPPTPIVAASAPIAMFLSPDGSRIVTGYGDFGLKLWDSVSGRLIATLADNDSFSYEFAMCPRGIHFVASMLTQDGFGSEVAVWNLNDGRRIFSTAVPQQGRD